MISPVEFLCTPSLCPLPFSSLPSFPHVMIITISSSLRPFQPTRGQPCCCQSVTQPFGRSVGRFIVIARVLSAPLIFSLSLSLSFFLVGGVALAFPARASIVRALTRPVLLILPSPPPSSAPARRSVRPSPSEKSSGAAAAGWTKTTFPRGTLP